MVLRCFRPGVLGDGQAGICGPLGHGDEWHQFLPKRVEALQERVCRVCFCGEEEGPLLAPCRCRGSVRYVHASCLNEWRVQLGKKDALAYHLDVWQTELQCPGEGKYAWNEKFQTYESSVFGHPGKPSMPAKGIGLLSSFGAVDFGITFENDGLRVQASVSSKPPVTKPPAED